MTEWFIMTSQRKLFVNEKKYPFKCNRFLWLVTYMRFVSIKYWNLLNFFYFHKLQKGCFLVCCLFVLLDTCLIVFVSGINSCSLRTCMHCLAHNPTEVHDIASYFHCRECDKQVYFKLLWLKSIYDQTILNLENKICSHYFRQSFFCFSLYTPIAGVT